MEGSFLGLTLITGPARSGKTAAALERLKEYSPVDLAQKVRYIVPTKEAARQIESRLMKRLGVSGLLGNTACTFFSFASEFIAHEGLASRLISDEKKELTLRKLVLGAELDYLEASAEFPGFIRALDQIIGDLKLALIEPDHLIEAIQKTRANLLESSLRKLKELAGFYRQYQEKILVDHGLHDREGLMWLAREAAAKGRSPRFALTVFDGFDEMNALQRKFVRTLVERGQEVVLVLTYEPDREEIFGPAGDIREFALSMGADEIVSTGSGSGAPDRLRECLFRSDEPVETNDDRVAIIEGCDPLMEVELAAEEIQRLVSQGDYQWDDILVTSRDLGAYQDRVIDVFASAGIPVNAGKRPLTESTFIKTLLGCIAVVRDDWPRDEVLRLLKSSMLQPESFRDGGLSACEVEIAAKSGGIVGGYKVWRANWDDNDKTRAFRAEALKPVYDFDQQVKDARSSLPEMAAAVRTLAKRFNWRLHDEASLAEDAAAAVKLDQILKELETSEGFIKAGNHRDFFGYLEELLRLSDFEVPGPQFAAVTLAPVTALGGRDYPAVFVLGMLEKIFPRPPQEEAFLRDWERQILNGPLGGRLDVHLDGAAEQERFLFYRALGTARERVYLCYPLTGSEGKDSLPSFYIDEVRRAIADPRIIRRDHASLVPPPESVFGRPPLRRSVVFALAEGEASATAARTYNALLEKEPALLIEVWRASAARRAVLTDTSILAELAAREKRWSCSELETYALCPFKHFIEKTLGLKQIRDEVDPLDTGSLLHEVLNRLFTELRAELGGDLVVGKLKAGPTIDRALEILDECLGKQPRLSQLAPYDRDTLRYDMRTILTRYIRSEIKKARDGFIPTYFELEFGRADQPFVIEAETGPIEITGRIDRVDVSRGIEPGALVIDYKSGDSDRLTDYKNGTKIQPLIYAAAMQQLYGLRPLGAEYRPLKTWKPDGFYTDCSHIKASKNRVLGEIEFQQLLDECQEVVAGLVEEIKSGFIGIEPIECPGYCHLLGVCRYEKGLADGVQ
jgi:ATP-dependent helicase/nuclease subunit B